MLSLLCTSARGDDLDIGYENRSTGSSRQKVRRASLPPAPSNKRPIKRRITKGSIGSPEGFRHEQHIGVDGVGLIVSFISRAIARASTDLSLFPRLLPYFATSKGDIERWQRAVNPSVAPRETAFPPASPPPRAAPPLSPEPSDRVRRRASLSPPKRKPVPRMLSSEFESSSMSSANNSPASLPPRLPPPTPSSPLMDLEPLTSQSYGASSPPPHTRKHSEPANLVPLFNPSRPSADGHEPHYVTRTTKLKFEGALEEIERALNAQGPSPGTSPRDR
ncbi:hypothetical protein BOTBODRAFT_173526 [Botryobasidium botryosum FD-172 SS1]|uniref:CRIB domain-containing protein n=1 Tax=Botryobasidium botryosum (strain FD-172 SS1) TaxID=930990 RepID=A0A067MWG2_BOTB1|nr:hypothetical protein BOTBODRAFT_173526 [Botryobasidium botryosum FD-172 SS1]